MWADKIREILEEKNITMYKLSKISKVSKATLSRIMSGSNIEPRISTLIKIASALDIKLEDLISVEGDKYDCYKSKRQIGNDKGKKGR